MTTAPAPIPRRSGPRRVHVLMLAGLATMIAVGIALLVRGNGSTHFSSAPQGSGVAAAEVRTLPAFDRIDLAGANLVSVSIGPRQAVVVHGDDNLLRRITTDVRDRTLVVDNSGSYTSKVPMKVEVVVPALASATLSGSGMIAIGGIEARALSVSVPGSGLLTAAGRVDNLDAVLGGTGECLLGDLVARDATAVLQGSGRLDVHATRSLDARVDGTGVIRYTGRPGRISRAVNGTGTIVEE